MDQHMIYLWLILFWTPCEAAPVSDSLVVSVREPDHVQRGLSATIPCWLNPPQNAEDLEVRWYRENFDTPVLLYKAKTFDNSQQDASYAGRVSFGFKDATSGGLTAGDVSLKLVNTTLHDAGQYICYVSSFQGYDSSPVTLEVTETGVSPRLSVAWKEDNMVNVSCESEGWFPEPALRWSNLKQDLEPGSLLFNKAPSGLISVHSWLLVPSSSEVSCSVALHNKDTKEARLGLENAPQTAGNGSAAGWVAFALLLIAALAAVGVMCYKKRVKASKKSSDESDAAALEPLLQMEKANENYVNVELEATKNPFIKIKGNILRDAPGVPEVSCLSAVKGTRGFTGGRHYWEVSLRVSDHVEAKKSWWLGVTSASEIPNDLNFPPNTSNGFWFLSSSSDRADQLQFSTVPKVLLPFTVRPSTVGVYLDYDKGEISFYNVDQKSLIGSLAATFTGEVFPLFNPGKGDVSSMTILHRTEQSQSEPDSPHCQTDNGDCPVEDSIQQSVQESKTVQIG